MLVTYPDVAYLPVCVTGSEAPCLPFPDEAACRLVAKRCYTTEGILRRFGGGVMRSHWYHAPGLVLSGPRGWSQAWFLGNVARNSPAAASNLEFVSLELQRFERRLKTDRGKLCATFIR